MTLVLTFITVIKSKAQTTWNLTVNSNVTSTSYLGTNIGNSNPLIFKVNGAIAGRIDPAGPVTIKNTSFGLNSLGSITSGTSNSAFGNHTLISNQTGSNNSAVGTTALNNNTSGSGNAAFGYAALHNNSEGFSNCAFGSNALILKTTGDKILYLEIMQETTLQLDLTIFY